MAPSSRPALALAVLMLTRALALTAAAAEGAAPLAAPPLTTFASGVAARACELAPSPGETKNDGGTGAAASMNKIAAAAEGAAKRAAAAGANQDEGATTAEGAAASASHASEDHVASRAAAATCEGAASDEGAARAAAAVAEPAAAGALRAYKDKGAVCAAATRAVPAAAFASRASKGPVAARAAAAVTEGAFKDMCAATSECAATVEGAACAAATAAEPAATGASRAYKDKDEGATMLAAAATAEGAAACASCAPKDHGAFYAATAATECIAEADGPLQDATALKGSSPDGACKGASRAYKDEGGATPEGAAKGAARSTMNKGAARAATSAARAFNRKGASRAAANRPASIIAYAGGAAQPPGALAGSAAWSLGAAVALLQAASASASSLAPRTARSGGCAPTGLALALALLLALAAPLRAGAVCSGSTYSYGSGACASCAVGASFVSAAAGCAPSATLTAGPADTAFYLSGNAAEGAAAFTVSALAGISSVADPFGAAGGALALASGSYLTAPGASAPAALPAGGSVAWSASAWVKCAAPATWAGVLEWGAAGDAQQVASPQAAVLAVSAAVPPPYTGIVTTLAGSAGGYADGTGAAASFYNPYGVAAIPASGVIVVADVSNNRIRLVTPLGAVSTLAGSGSATFADGTGAAASFNTPSDVVVILSSGVIVVADTNNHRIRLVTPLGVVTTLAGGNPGYADGMGAAASFNGPVGVAINPSSGDIVVADHHNHRVRLVTYPGGDVTTLAGRGNAAFADGLGTSASFNYLYGVAVIPSSGAVVVADYHNNRIRLVTPLGVVTTLAGSGDGAFADGTGPAASFRYPLRVAVIPGSGVIVVGDYHNHRIRLVTPRGVATTLAGSGSAVYADGTGAAASFSHPVGVAFNPVGGAIVVADSGNHRIRHIPLPLALPACESTWHHVALTFSPSSTPFPLSAFLDGALVFASAATVTLPARAASTLRVGWSGDLTSNSGSLISGALAELRVYSRALSAAEVLELAQPPLSTFANSTAFPPVPTLGTTAYAASCASGFAGAPAALTKSLADGAWAWSGCVTAPPACAACASGTYSYGGSACARCAPGAAFVSAAASCAPLAALTAGPADTAFYLSGSAAEGVAALTVSAPAGVSNVVGHFGAAGGALALASGSYLTVPGVRAPAALPSGGSAAFSASAWVKCAAPATWAAALEWGAAGDAQQLASPQAAALVVSAAAQSASAVVTTLAGDGGGYWKDGTGLNSAFQVPHGVAVIPASGVIVVADQGNHKIRLVTTPVGVVTTLAGSGNGGYVDGTGVAASFFNPSGVAVIPSSGVIVVADLSNHCIRLVTPLGVVTTLAGSVNGGYVDGTGAAASFAGPRSVAVMPSSGVIVVADSGNNRIRLVTPFGVVTTLAGSGSPAFADGTGTAATFNGPTGIAVMSSMIVVADNSNRRIRLVDYTTGVVTTLAGNRFATFSDGTGTTASFIEPRGVAVIPSSGIILVADYGNHRIRLVTPLGVVTTLAGIGSNAYADGVGTAASFSSPSGVAVVPTSGTIVVADFYNCRIRLITLPFALPACDSTWHHVALTYSPSASPYTLSAFLDGALVFQVTATITLPARAASTLRVGWSGDLTSNSGSLFSGALAELRFFNRSLSAAEVLALSQPPLPSVAHATVSPAGPTLAAAAYTYSCDAGYGGATATLARSAIDGAWAWAGGGATPSCAACGLAGLYSYGFPSCAPCAPGSTFVSATAGCMPSATLAAGPTDTAFYLSGASAEGVGALSLVGAVPAAAAGPFGAAAGVGGGAGGALALVSGSYLAVTGTSAPTALPAGGSVAFSASAWVKCAAPTTWAGVLEWGAAGDAQQAASPQTLALNVNGAAPSANSGIVTTLAGSGGYADGTGTAASFSSPCGVALIPSSGVIIVADNNNHRIRLVTPLGAVTTLAGSGTQAFADGVGAAASFNTPNGVAVIPSSGVIVVADNRNHRVRLVTPLGAVTTLAGSGSSAYADGTGTTASFTRLESPLFPQAA